MEISSEREDLILNNLRLVHFVVRQYAFHADYLEYDDLVSIGTIGLIKAVDTFDKSKKLRFSSYATICIRNEVLMYFRKTNKYAKDIPMDELIQGGEEITLNYQIEDPNSDFTERMLNREEVIYYLSVILNYLTGKSRLAILYKMGGKVQIEIHKMLNISQSRVSRITSEAIRNIKEAIISGVQYKEIFNMEILRGKLRMSFSTKDIRNFNKIFASLLQKTEFTEILSYFKVDCNKERAVIQMPLDQEAFIILAKIIQEIDNFSMTFISDECVLDANDNVPDETKLGDKA